MFILNFLLFYTLNLIKMPSLKVYKQPYYFYMNTFNIIILFILCGYWTFLSFYAHNLIIMPTLNAYKKLYCFYMNTFKIIILFKLCRYWSFYHFYTHNLIKTNGLKVYKQLNYFFTFALLNTLNNVKTSIFFIIFKLFNIIFVDSLQRLIKICVAKFLWVVNYHKNNVKNYTNNKKDRCFYIV